MLHLYRANKILRKWFLLIVLVLFINDTPSPSVLSLSLLSIFEILNVLVIFFLLSVIKADTITMSTFINSGEGFWLEVWLRVYQ